MRHLLDAELRELKRLQRRLVSRANKLVWSRALQKRATRVAALLRRLPPLVVVEGTERSRVTDGWLLEVVDGDGVRTEVLRLVTATPARSAAELACPLLLVVHRADLVRLAKLEELASSGIVVLVYSEAA